MAIIYKGIKCPICDETLDTKEKFVATTHFIGDEADPLWRYSDAAMHYACFQEWKHRETFVEKYNNTIGKIVWGNGTRHHMNDDGIVVSIIAAESKEPPANVD
ncbi:MAG: hypothetical protein AB8C95_07690 [Phycisphaeraceae bacterium]